MMELFKVAAKMVLDRSEYDHDVTEADKSGKNLAENLSGYFEKAKKVLTGVLSAVAVQKVASSIWNLAKETSAAGDRIDKTSQALGMSRRAFQEWDYILAQSGASIDSMGMSMKTMQEAIMGNSAETAVALSKLGLSAAKLQNLSPEQQFEELVKAFQKMPDGAKKSQYAMQLFGRNAQSLMPLLNSASGTVDELRNRAHELGLIMSDEDVDASVAFGDALDDLNRVWTAVKQKFGAQMLPTLTQGMVALANSLGKITNQITNAFKTGDWSAVFDTITGEIKNLLPGFINTIVNVGVGIFQNADKIISLGFSIITGIIGGLRDNMPTLVQKIPDIFNAMVNGIKELGTAAGNGIIDLINIAFGTNIPHLDKITWPTWDDVKTAFETAWKLIEQEATKLMKLVFGETEDGGVNWPTWDDVKEAATKAWNTIKDGALKIADVAGGMIFGKKEDGTVAWPTWDDVLTAATEAWNAIKTKALDLAGFVFGKKEDGTVDWPTWDDVKAKATEVWNYIKEKALGLVGLVFGKKEDGSVDWPTWDQVQAKAIEIWDSIKAKALDLAGLVFGKKEDGTVNFPTWDEVSAKATEIWDAIKAKAVEFAGLIFGKKEDGSVDWPTWNEVVVKATEVWNGIKEKALGLAGLVFGKKEDGTVDWPTWDEVAAKATEVWDSIKAEAKKLAGLVFGTKEDGSVAWPDINAIIDSFNTWWDNTAKPAIQSAATWTLKLFGVPEENADAIGEIISRWWEPLKNGVEDVIQWALNLPGEPYDAGTQLHDIVVKWWNGIKKNLQDLLKWVLGIPSMEDAEGSDMKAAIQTWWDEKVVPFLEDILDFTLGLFGLPSVADMVKKIEDWWKQVTDNLNLVLGISVGGTGGNAFGGTSSGTAPTYGTDSTKEEVLSTPWWVGMPSFFAHAKGLNYVPYDGYLASLHRGETVLNQSQGRNWRQNNNGIDTNLLYSAVASAVAAAVGDIQINMNGKAVANAVSGQVSRNLYQNALGRRYAAV